MLETAIEIIRKHHYNVYSLCEWENGKMRQEALQPANRLNNCYSLSKSFTSAAVGMLEYENKLSREDTIDAYIADLFPAENAEKLRQVKIRDLLSHAAGFAEGTLFEGDQYDHETDDWATYSLSRPLPYPPGEKSVYSNATYYLLARIAERAAGRPAFDYLRDRLLRPLGFRGYAAMTCPEGHTFGASGMFFSCADLLTFGRLLLGGGELGGRRYLSEDYVREASSPLLPCGERFYGLGFWKNKADDSFFYGDGAHGQLILINPPAGGVLTMQSYDDRIDMKSFTAALARADGSLYR